MHTAVLIASTIVILFCTGGCNDGSVSLATVAADSTVLDAGNGISTDVLEPFDALVDSEFDQSDPNFMPQRVELFVSLDSRPAANTIVTQGGSQRKWLTDESGSVTIELDLEIEGDIVVMASHPDARIGAAEVYPGVELPLVINLYRFGPDNPDYRFQDPGEPTRRPDTSQCAHCHQTINEAWYASPHRTSASNPRVQDLYAGVGSGLTDEERCTDAGGRWMMGLEPGTREPVARCYIGDGLLPALNPDCGEENSCDEVATQYGGCADCHAPGMNGQLGGRDLLDATSYAYHYGVFCNVCHQVESVVLDAQPGVAGRLSILRPGEPASAALGAGGVLPLTFGPSHDSPNPRMGSVQRDHFRNAEICAGCHQLDQAPHTAELALDPERWPDGRLPVQSTWEEWRTGPLAAATRCQSCHMPPDPAVKNSADLQIFTGATVGIQGGWARPPGSTRAHSWVGPRQPKSRLLQLAAGVFIRDLRLVDGLFEFSVEVKNAACGHGLPTGEPFRSMILKVEATCGEDRLPAIGGDAVPDFAGYRTRQEAGNWSRWPEAQVGDIVRVVRRTGEWHDYNGFAPFGTDGLAAEDKGMPVERVVGEVVITEVNGESIVFDEPVPEGDVAYLIDGAQANRALAGAAGFAFARILTSPDGRRMVPHFMANDVASDNRLLPQESWTSTHTFEADCPSPRAKATLIYRPFPLALVEERGWDVADTVMVETQR